MNTKDALNVLKKYFTGYTCKIHEQFIIELGKLLKKELKGKEEIFFKGFTTQLNNIRTFGYLVHRTDDNEILKGGDGHFYSIHLQHKQFNIRFIIYIDKDNVPYFLCCFYEREGKRKTDYTSYTLVMKQRLEQLLEEEDIDE